MKSGPLKWHGGKAYLAPKIRALFPPHTRYCEPYFGGGAVLLAGDGEGVSEFANDLNWRLSHFWSALGDPWCFAEFRRAVEAKPFSRKEFIAAERRLRGGGSHDWRKIAVDFFLVNRQSRQGLMKDFATPTGRLRRGMNENVSAWLTAIEGLPEFHSRIKRVQISDDDALDFIKELDSPETLFYCDPPYMHEARSSVGEYHEYEMSKEEHATLLDVLGDIQGKFLLSGYRSKLYDDFAEASNWRRVDFEIDNKASSAKVKEKKTECVWMNYGGTA